MVRGLLILACAMALATPADGSTEELIRAGITTFHRAYETWEGERFRVAAALFRQAGAQAPKDVWPHYWLGVTEFHRLLHARSQLASRTNTGVAEEALDAALAALQRVVQLDPRHAESHALLGTLYGLRIEGRLWRAARLGPRVQHHRAQALAWGADNPRVRYLLGTCQLHLAGKPAALQEALATLLAAERLYAAEAEQPVGPLEPRWGRASCLTFIGRVYERLGQRAEAAGYYRQALALHPGDHLAQAGLARVTSQP